MEPPCKVYYCYKATNTVNGKVYIGFAGSPKQRWSQHKRDAEKGKGFALAAAIQKYGWAAFAFEVICCGRNKREMLEHIEPALIEQYQSRVNQNGYNVTRGGEQFPSHNRGGSKKGRIVSKESRLRMSAAKRGNVNAAGNKGHKHSENTRQKMSAAHQGHIVTQETRTKIGAGNRGRPLTEERKKKLRELHKGCIDSKETRQKKSAALKGRIVTEKTRLKIGAANKGHIVTQETRMKISAARKSKYKVGGLYGCGST